MSETVGLSWIEVQTGLRGFQLQRRLRQGLELHIVGRFAGHDAEVVPLAFGSRHRIAYLTYSDPSIGTTEVTPIDIGPVSTVDRALDYLSAAGGVPAAMIGMLKK